jgi:hypothetical protein
MPPLRRLAIVASLVAALLVLPPATQAHAGLVPPPWSGSASRAHASVTPRRAAPRPPAPPVDGALVGAGAMMLVALLGCAGRTVTVRLA